MLQRITIGYIALFCVGATIGRPQFRNEIQVFEQSAGG